jgi:hypothetical protein
MLGNYEQQNGRQLRAQGLDPDTLSYTYTFDDPQVAQFFGEVSEWNRRLHHLYYPAKSLSRYGSTGAIGAQANALRTGVAKFRDAMCDALIDAIDELMTHGTSGASLGISLPVITHELADCVIACLLPLDEAHSRHPVVQQALEAARRISAKTNSRPSVRRGIY